MLFTIASSPAQSVAPTTHVRKYISPDRSFEISVPSGYVVLTGEHKPSKSMIPVCHDESLVCITVQPGDYEGTNFEGASAEFTVKSAKNPETCVTPEMSASGDAEFRIETKSPSRSIDNTRFVHGITGGAAAGHHIGTNLYRGFKNGTCYELATNVTSSSFANFDPGTIKEFTQQAEQQLTAKLLQIVDSFRSLR